MKELLLLIVREYDISNEEIQILLHNYCDATMYNKYLREKKDYLTLNSISQQKQQALIEYFRNRDIDKDTCKRIIISSPMILYCEDFEEQLDIVYKDSTFEGIIIKDDEGNNHPYRVKNNLRSITENPFMLNELVMSSNNDYKKVYYTRNKKQS